MFTLLNLSAGDSDSVTSPTFLLVLFLVRAILMLKDF